MWGFVGFRASESRCGVQQEESSSAHQASRLTARTVLIELTALYCYWCYDVGYWYGNRWWPMHDQPHAIAWVLVVVWAPRSSGDCWLMSDG